MFALSRKTMWLKVISLFFCIVLSLSVLRAENIKQTPRVALIYSSFVDPFPPITDYDDICHDLGWILDKWENTELDKLVKNLDCYDIVLCGRKYNFINRQRFEKYTKQWLAFMKKGGVIIVAPVMEAPLKWIKSLGPGFQLATKLNSAANSQTAAEPGAKLDFGHVPPRWAEFRQLSPEWKVTTRNANGKPLVVYREVGNGLFLASTTYVKKAYQKKSFGFPVGKDLKVIRDFIINKRANASPVTITSLSWGKKSFGENILQLNAKNKKTGPAPAAIMPAVSLFRDRKNIFVSPGKTYKIPSGGQEEISLSYPVTSAVPDLVTFTVSGSDGSIYFRSAERINIEDLKAPLEKSEEKLAESRKIIVFLETFSGDRLPDWFKVCLNEETEKYSALKKKIETLEKELKEIARQGSAAAWNGEKKIIFQTEKAVNELHEYLEILRKKAATWKNLKLSGTAGKNKSFALSDASAFEKIFRDKILKGAVVRRLKFEMAANEYENIQLVIVPLAKALDGVKITCSNLTGANAGNMIPAGNIDIRRVGYVFSSDGNWYPDPLLRNRIFNIGSEQVVQPIWITVHTPPGTPPGEYKGYLTVQTQKPESKVSLPVMVKVWNFKVPEKLNLPTDANLRVSALAGFFYGAKAAEDPEKYISPAAYREFLKFLLRYRITPKPWNSKGQPLAGIPYLKWEWNGDKLALDFSEYDKNVELILNSGGKIVYAGSLPAFYSLRKNIKFPPMEKYIPLIYEHLKQKNWLDIAYFYGYDEPTPAKLEMVKKEMALCGKFAPGVKRLVPYGSKRFSEKMFADSKRGEYIDIWVPNRNPLLDKNLTEKLKARGEIVWGYDSGGPSYEIASPNIEKRILLWVLRKYDLEGFLIWGTVICWGGTPNDIDDDGTPEKSWKPGPGDGYYAYPAGKRIKDGLNPSIRLEVMRGGFEDWEYFHLLKEKLTELKRKDRNKYQNLIKETGKLLEIDDQLVKDSRTYTKDPEKLLLKRKKIAGQIEKIIQVIGSSK
ncbi:MAG: glycoside hydrolase domain-containing protein [Victivallales bacterium]